MAELRPLVLERERWRCARCGRSLEELQREGLWLQVHHRLPRGQGGPDTLANLVALCGPNTDRRSCHAWVHREGRAARAAGLLLSPADGPPDEAWYGLQRGLPPLGW